MRKRSLWLPVLGIACCSLVSFSCTHKDKFTRGIGIYPGNPAESFAPALKPDKDNYRNIARYRPAYHSSSYDYNLTAQLITDGIITQGVPNYFSLKTTEGVVAKNEREWLLDHVTGSVKEIRGKDIWLVFSVGGDDQSPEVNRIVINGDLTYDNKLPGGWSVKFSGSDDGVNWEVLDQLQGTGLPGKVKPDWFAEMQKNMPKDSTGKPMNPFADFLAQQIRMNPNLLLIFNWGHQNQQGKSIRFFNLKHL